MYIQANINTKTRQTDTLSNVESIETVIEKYKKTVYAIALSHVGNKFDADDVFQEVFLIYFKKSKVFQSEEHQKAWLIRTTLNRCKKITHSNWRKKTVSYDEIEASEQTFLFSSANENLVYSALLELPEKYRTVLHLYYFEEYSTDEISEIIKTKATTVRVRMKRGREMMKEKLKGELFE